MSRKQDDSPDKVIRLAVGDEPAQSLAEADRERIAGMVRQIDDLVQYAVEHQHAQLDEATNPTTARIPLGLDLNTARAAKLWVETRRTLLDSHPGLLRLHGEGVDTQPTVDREALADAVEALLRATR